MRIYNTNTDFKIGEEVWWAYAYTKSGEVDKNGLQVLSQDNKMVFSLPQKGLYKSDLPNARGISKMVIDGARNKTKKIVAKSFSNALKMLVTKLEKKDRKNKNTLLMDKLTEMIPTSEYYELNPEWFV